MKKMIRFHFGENGKLVRDKLPQVIESQKHTVETRKLDKQQLAKHIIEKMPEETKEISEALRKGDEKEIIEEIADLQTLIDSLITVTGLDTNKINEVKQKKNNRIGAFVRGAFIVRVGLNSEGQDYDYWLNYFRKNNDRYIEE